MRVATAAVAVAIVQAALSEAPKYSKQRIQFAQPLLRFQAIQNRNHSAINVHCNGET